jgi:hypothetical protein
MSPILESPVPMTDDGYISYVVEKIVGHEFKKNVRFTTRTGSVTDRQPADSNIRAICC